MKLTIVIVSYNVRTFVAQCLDSVQKASEGIDGVEVFVVDNASSDDTVDYIGTHYPWVHLIANDDNLGFSRANNIAIRQAEGEYVLLLNPDTIVAEPTLRACVSFMDAHPQAGGLGVRMHNADGTLAPESRRAIPSPWVSCLKMLGFTKRYYMSHLSWDEPGRIEVVSGAFFMIRKTALDEVGLLDEDFFMYGEDIDLSYRILQAGYQNRYLPLPIVHYKGESTTKTSYRYVQVFYDAMIIFFNKHFQRYSRLFALLVRIVVGCKKVGTYIGQNLHARSRRLADFTENCLYVGRRETFADVERLISGSTYLRNPQFVEGADDAGSALEGRIDNGVKAVIFDTDAFSYDAILYWMYSRAQEGKRYTMGLYSANTGKLITEDEVI